MFLNVASAVGSSDGRRPLPRGPHRLERGAVLASQRGRMLAAVTAVVAERGYARTTVADIIAVAGVSRKTFYEHFADKEQCFLAAYDAAAEELLGRVRAAAPDGPGTVDAAHARVRAYLGALAERPDVAHTFLIEIAAAGPRALARRDAVLDAFAELAAPLAPGSSRDVRLACVGATDTLVTRWVRRGRAARLSELTETVVGLTVALLGP